MDLFELYGLAHGAEETILRSTRQDRVVDLSPNKFARCGDTGATAGRAARQSVGHAEGGGESADQSAPASVGSIESGTPIEDSDRLRLEVCVCVCVYVCVNV
ncbi:unnamed protein product [Protopolystoma xenopodis]|uniref:Uncharacterized protein n=1 Tax=Protopolystoma xenopodis TaxID=117903 RepID=A0A3S5BA37_9PLAT|nr:unnamed protein product [Protopolystoma xenopodis]